MSVKRVQDTSERCIAIKTHTDKDSNLIRSQISRFLCQQL